MSKRIKDARISAHLTQKQFSELLGIPINTVKSWDSDRRRTPEWTENLVIAELNRKIQERS